MSKKCIVKKIAGLFLAVSMVLGMAQAIPAASGVIADPPIICKDPVKKTKQVTYQLSGDYVIARIRNVSGTVKISSYVTFDKKKYPVKVIGTTGNNTKTTQVILPKTATTVQAKTFCRFSKLKKIQVEKGNKYFKSINNMLLSKNGKTLYAVTTQVKGSVLIPEGVKVIKSWACANRNIKEVFLPKGIKTVGSYAFSNNKNLKRIYYIFDDNIKFGKNAYNKKTTSLLSLIENPILK